MIWGGGLLKLHTESGAAVPNQSAFRFYLSPDKVTELALKEDICMIKRGAFLY